jgi:hypothetical protein
VADGPFKIKVQIAATIDGVDPVTETVEQSATALVKLRCEVEPGTPASARIMPDGVKQPSLLLVKPLQAYWDFPSRKPNAAPNEKDRVTEQLTAALPDGSLWYSTVDSGANPGEKPDQWKPIVGGHVFVNGMAEWVTDMVAPGTAPGQGRPGPLTELHFRNTGKKKVTQKFKGPDGSDKTEDHEAVIVMLVVAGYSPEPVKGGGDEGKRDYERRAE